MTPLPGGRCSCSRGALHGSRRVGRWRRALRNGPAAARRAGRRAQPAAGDAAPRRTSARRSPVHAGPPPLQPLAAARPPPRRPDVRSVRRGARSSRSANLGRASASAQRSCAPSRQPPGIDSYTARRTSGCRNRKRRGTSVWRMRSSRSSSSSASIAAASSAPAAAAASSGSKGSPATAAPSRTRRAGFVEQSELLGERGGDCGWDVDTCERAARRAGGLSETVGLTARVARGRRDCRRSPRRAWPRLLRPRSARAHPRGRALRGRCARSCRRGAPVRARR